MSELPPATLEGWYALHQVASLDWGALDEWAAGDRAALADETRTLLAELAAPDAGWSATFQLVGGGADFLFLHFRETLDALAEAELRLRRSRLGRLLRVHYDFTSVTEAGLYAATVDAAAEAKPHSPEYQRILEELAAAERASPHVHVRLYPDVPPEMRYISFYPMNKRRVHPDNWYMLPVEERNRLMREHGLSARRYSGRIFQIITGAVGFDDWEWGVTLFAREPLEFKRIVTELRYDEASARYGEFGEFFTGLRMDADAWHSLLRES